MSISWDTICIKDSGDKEVNEQTLCKLPGTIKEYMDKVAQLVTRQINVADGLLKFKVQLSPLFSEAEIRAIYYRKIFLYTPSSSEVSKQQREVVKRICILSEGFVSHSYNGLRLLRTHILSQLHKERIDYGNDKISLALIPAEGRGRIVSYKDHLEKLINSAITGFFFLERNSLPQEFTSNLIAASKSLIEHALKTILEVKKEIIGLTKENPDRFDRLQEHFSFLMQCLNEPETLYPLLLMPLSNDYSIGLAPATRVSLQECQMAARAYVLSIGCFEGYHETFEKLQEKIKDSIFPDSLRKIKTSMVNELDNIKSFLSRVKTRSIALGVLIDRCGQPSFQKALSSISCNRQELPQSVLEIINHIESVEQCIKKVDRSYLQDLTTLSKVQKSCRVAVVNFEDAIKKEKVDIKIIKANSELKKHTSDLGITFNSHLHHSFNFLRGVADSTTSACKGRWEKIAIQYQKFQSWESKLKEESQSCYVKKVHVHFLESSRMMNALRGSCLKLIDSNQEFNNKISFTIVYLFRFYCLVNHFISVSSITGQNQDRGDIDKILRDLRIVYNRFFHSLEEVCKALTGNKEYSGSLIFLNEFKQSFSVYNESIPILTETESIMKRLGFVTPEDSTVVLENSLCYLNQSVGNRIRLSSADENFFRKILNLIVVLTKHDFSPGLVLSFIPRTEEHKIFSEKICAYFNKFEIWEKEILTTFAPERIQGDIRPWVWKYLDILHLIKETVEKFNVYELAAGLPQVEEDTQLLFNHSLDTLKLQCKKHREIVYSLFYLPSLPLIAWAADHPPESLPLSPKELHAHTAITAALEIPEQPLVASHVEAAAISSRSVATSQQADFAVAVERVQALIQNLEVRSPKHAKEYTENVNHALERLKRVIRANHTECPYSQALALSLYESVVLEQTMKYLIAVEAPESLEKMHQGRKLASVHDLQILHTALRSIPSNSSSLSPEEVGKLDSLRSVAEKISRYPFFAEGLMEQRLNNFRSQSILKSRLEQNQLSPKERESCQKLYGADSSQWLQKLNVEIEGKLKNILYPESARIILLVANLLKLPLSPDFFKIQASVEPVFSIQPCARLPLMPHQEELGKILNNTRSLAKEIENVFLAMHESYVQPISSTEPAWQVTKRQQLVYSTVKNILDYLITIQECVMKRQQLNCSYVDADIAFLYTALLLEQAETLLMTYYRIPDPADHTQHQLFATVDTTQRLFLYTHDTEAFLKIVQDTSHLELTKEEWALATDLKEVVGKTNRYPARQEGTISEVLKRIKKFDEMRYIWIKGEGFLTSPQAELFRRELGRDSGDLLPLIDGLLMPEVQNQVHNRVRIGLMLGHKLLNHFRMLYGNKERNE